MPVRLEVTHFGLRSTVWDPLTVQEERSWLAGIKEQVPTLETFYGQLIDLRGRGVGGLSDPSIVVDAMHYVLAHGLLRSAVVVADPLIAMHVKRLSWDSGVYEWERYIDASVEPDWERLAVEWIDHGIDPDL